MLVAMKHGYLVSLVALAASSLLGCNPDGTCEKPIGPQNVPSCSDSTKKGCEAVQGTFTAGKVCTDLGYKSCQGGFYKPGSIMCQ